jgi:hypothetical protein
MTDIGKAAPAPYFSTAGNNDLMVLDGILRARGRHPTAKSIECLIDFPFDSPAPASAGRPTIREVISGDIVPGLERIVPDSVNQKMGTSSVLTKNADAQLAYQPRIINLTDFTLEGWLRFPDVTYAGANKWIWGEYLGVNGIKRWIFSYNNQVFTPYTSSAAGANDFFNCDCSGNPLVNNTWYRYQMTYSESITTCTFEVKDSAGVTKGTGSSNTAKVMPSPDAYNHPGLHLGLKLDGALGVYTSTGYDELLIDDTQLYSGVVPTFSVPTTTQPVFATGAGGDECDDATVTLDSGIANSSWRMNSLTVDDVLQWAALVGGNGWTIRYEASNNIAPGTYSAWMTLADFLLEANPTGQYMHISVRCHDSAGVNFYPLAWIDMTVNTAATAGISRGRAVNAGA